MKALFYISFAAQLKSLIILIAGLLFFVGCNKEDSTAPIDQQTEMSVNEDAAESLASAVGEENGGVVDQIGDALAAASSEGFSALGKGSSEQVVAEYDSINGVWTVTINRERGNPAGVPYAMVYRVYKYQFLNANQQPQRNWITNGDTARTVTCEIVEGAGEHRTRRLSQELTGLSGSFIATDAHTLNPIINGTYFRSATDTLTTHRAVRTLTHSIDMDIINLVGPRGSRRDLSQKVSGTITGTYQAEITFTSGDAYRERNVTREFTIVIGGGDADISMAGETYSADVTTGELKDN